jgi:hypothetical protein
MLPISCWTVDYCAEGNEMTVVHFDAKVDDNARRESLYSGEVFVYSPTPNSQELCALAREVAEEAFAPHDPRDAQHKIPVEKFVNILAKLKPSFIHHPRAKELIPGILSELGCDLHDTYFDVPRLRSSAQRFRNNLIALQLLHMPHSIRNRGIRE